MRVFSSVVVNREVESYVTAGCDAQTQSDFVRQVESTMEQKWYLSLCPNPRVTQGEEVEANAQAQVLLRDEKTLLREPYKKVVLLIYYSDRGSVSMKHESC